MAFLRPCMQFALRAAVAYFLATTCRPLSAADALDRPVTLPKVPLPLGNFCRLVSEQSGAPIRIDGEALVQDGIGYGAAVVMPAEGEPAGSVLWRYLIKYRHPQLVFLIHRNADGVVKEIEFTTRRAAWDAKAPFPYEARFLSGITPFLEAPKEIEATYALQNLPGFGPEGRDAIPTLQRLLAKSDLPPRLRLHAELVVTHIEKAVQRRDGPIVRPAKAPPEGDWLSTPLRLPRDGYVIDELGAAISSETGVPIVIRYDDFARDDKLVAGAVVLESRHDTVGGLLWRAAAEKNLFIVLRKNAAGAPQRLEVTTAAAADRRTEAAAADEGSVRGVLPMLDDPRDYVQSQALAALDRMGPAVVYAEPRLRALSRSDGRVRDLLDRARKVREEIRRVQGP